MFKMLLGFGIGAILALALALGPLQPMLTNGQQKAPGNSNIETVNSDNPDSVTVTAADIKVMLDDAGANITDQKTKDYYQKLVSSYHLEDVPDVAPTVDGTEPAEALPDMERISHSAIVMPLEEAGKGIQDSDTAKFYYKLLSDSGWDIKR
jgi:hypothetical protein